MTTYYCVIKYLPSEPFSIVNADHFKIYRDVVELSLSFAHLLVLLRCIIKHFILLIWKTIIASRFIYREMQQKLDLSFGTLCCHSTASILVNIAKVNWI